MKVLNILIFISYIIFLNLVFIYSKNLQNSSPKESYILDSQVECPKNCKDGLCDNVTLKCDSCIDGYYKDDCSVSCPAKGCKNCNQTTGECQICKEDLILIDNFCCIENCLKCDNTGCIECSEETKYGPECKDCPENCFYENLKTKRKCEQDSGNCYSCIKGKTGIKCEDNCNQGCDLTEYNCDMNNGSCYCKEGFYGETCEDECDDNCEKCDKKNGTCYQCKSGYYPKNKKCINCPENCDGECPEGKCEKCKDSFYGDICNKKCSIYCLNNICEQEDGFCECINFFSYESHCTECMNQFDKKTNCTECINKFDKTTNCTECINNYNETTNCTECINNYNETTNCTECKNNYNISTECTTCINNYDIKTDCKDCKNNYNISTKCKECINKYDKTTDCKECKNNYNISTKCKECINKYDKTTDCKECKNNYNISTKCKECINNYDMETDCKKCKENYDIDSDCENCTKNYDIQFNCEKCINHYNITTSCTECDNHFSLISECESCEDNYDIYTDCTECINQYDKETNCQTCLNGFYGNNCTEKCYEGCDTIKENCEKEDGKCKNCRDLYYGEKCEYKSEIPHCINVNRTNGACLECEQKFYLYNNTCEACSIDCNNSLCEDITGKCYSCASLDSYGEKCEKKCSKFCKNEIKENIVCKRDDGTCNEGCVDIGNFSDPQCTDCIDGYYPRDEGCTTPCSTHCLDKCDTDDGSCTECFVPYYGEKCDEICSFLCKSACDKIYGNCLECIDGYYKDEKDPEGKYGCVECPKQCIKCRSKIKCEACIDNYYGEQCNEICSPNCKNENCEIDGKCDCKDEYYGENCALKCFGCYGEGCYDDNGICKKHYCNDKYYDPRKCDKNCDENCGGVGGCDLFTGECSVCKGNNWGKKCENSCVKECEDDGRVDCCYVKSTSTKGIHIDIIEKKRSNLWEENDEFYIFKINLGGFDLNILADFESNSPLVIFDKSTEIKRSEAVIYNISIDLTYDSTKSADYSEDKSEDTLYEYDGFSLVKEKNAKDTLILENIKFENFSFLICQYYKLSKDFDNAGQINGIVGLGLRNYFSENLYYIDKKDSRDNLPKNIIIKEIDELKKKSIYIGDYNQEIRKGFSKLSTMNIENKQYIQMNSLIKFETKFTGIAYSLRKAYQYNYDKLVKVDNKIETTIVFNNLYKQFFEKLYFGDLFDNGCYSRSLQGGEVEYYCDIGKKTSIQTLPKLGLILGDYIYYLSYQFLYKESGQFITFLIKLHGQSQQKIELGKSFFNEFSVVYNNGNETLNFYGDIKKLTVPLRDPYNLLNIDSDIFTPGGWVTIIVFVLALLIIICYLSKYCFNKNDSDDSDDEEMEEDDELLVDDTIEDDDDDEDDDEDDDKNDNNDDEEDEDDDDDDDDEDDN